MQKQFDDHLAAVEALRAASADVARCARLLIATFKAGRRVYVLGNGGSAADAQHIAAELVGRFKRSDKPALPAMALTTDTSNLTAISNDFGFEQVFARQVQAHVQADDVVWALSVSGTSPNVLEAIQVARRQGAKIIGFSGQNGGAMRDFCDVCLLAAHTDSDRVQEIHQLAYHMICDLVEEAFV